MSNAHTVSYTAAELLSLLKTEGSKTDWANVDSISDTDLDALIASDSEEGVSELSQELPVVTPVILGLPANLSRQLPSAASDRNREVSRIVANYLKRRAARSRSAG